MQQTAKRVAQSTGEAVERLTSKAAQEEGLEVAIMDGTNIDNLDCYLSRKKFDGTVIRG